ncbi:THAP domain-containing protein 9 [Cyphomyrmex costatus]|uniref:THAP domain-containing protein 9 n=1 Tax=Cyphomyrmex costatus TaxID=456900 RepID=A0A151ILR7_9HYME|nr:THAP domain-containing protein 9 [Cyphomyrmex costatus]
MACNFEIGSAFKPYFINPITKEKVFCFFDPCHMLKLVRNTLGDQKILKSKGGDIHWQDIVLLQKLEEEEGLRAGTKLTKKHILYKNNKMNVKIAPQTLSKSVSSALKYVHESGFKQFFSPENTAEFCLMFNNAFDILNVRSQFANRSNYKVPLTDENYNELKAQADKIIQYITDLQTVQHQLPILKSGRKVGFLGLIICL